MRFAPDHTNSFETEAFSCACSGIDVIRPGAAKCKQGCLTLFSGLNQVVFELAPFVAANLAISEIFAFDT